MAVKITAIVCAYNEARHLPACLHSLLAQTRPPDEILVVNNASTDETLAVASAIAGVRVIDEPVKGLVVAGESARRVARGEVLAYVDADCRAPLRWLERVEAQLLASPEAVGMTGPYRFYDWDASGRAIIRLYDLLVAPATHLLVHHALGLGAVLYGGNFAVRAEALVKIGGFDRSIEFHGEDTNLGRRLTRIGRVRMCADCWVWTSARRYRAMGKRRVYGRTGHFDVIAITDHILMERDLLARVGRLASLGYRPVFGDRGSLRRVSGRDRERGNSREAALRNARGARCGDYAEPYSQQEEFAHCRAEPAEVGERVGALVDVWEAANRDDLFSVTSLKHYPYVANSDFHKPKHLYSWKTLIRCEKDWDAIAQALRSNVDVALTLYRNGSWAA